MKIVPIHFVCPCCGFAGLEQNPYRHLPPPPWSDAGHGAAPYCAKYGDPSYESCACCAFEFGSDDDPGTAPPVSFRQHRQQWIAEGCHWLEEEKKKKDWSLSDQLSVIGIHDGKEAIQPPQTTTGSEAPARV